MQVKKIVYICLNTRALRKKIQIILLIVFGFFTNAGATHLMGGEITWVCLGNGNYQFQMKVYRDCITAVYITNGGPISLTVHNHPTVTTIPMSIVDSTDISPQCNGAGPSYNCSNITPGNTAVKEYILKSNPVNLPGIPPAEGWIFTWSNCCRNASITNLSLNFETIKDKLNETYKIEKSHTVLFVFCLLTNIYAVFTNSIGTAVILFIGNILFNYYPNLLQQYNRIRYKRVVNNYSPAVITYDKP
jgi:hypothetical protein